MHLVPFDDAISQAPRSGPLWNRTSLPRRNGWMSVSGSTLQPVDEAVAPTGSVGATRLACAEPMQSARVVVEHVTADVLATHRDAWADLCSRSLDPNIFLDPAFALPLLQHVGQHDRLRFLLIWEDCGPTFFGRLLGLFPLELPRTRLAPIARGLAHEQTSCGTPLVDRTQATAVFDAALTWLDGPRGRSAALALTEVAEDGAFLAMLRRSCGETSRRVTILEERERAVLHRPDGAASPIASFASAKRRKERARQLRRLSETGVRTYASARTASDVATAMERFLALELKGWKGARGTALLADPSLATFVRTMTRLMARDGRCRVDSIEIDGRPVAMGIILSDGDRAYFWKTTFDEAYASFSPGVQLTLELTRTQLCDEKVAMTDSCAVANHPMINRLWTDRAAVVDVIVSVRSGRDRRFDRSLSLETLRCGLRRRAKTLLHMARSMRNR